jgi:hypothetical protein
LLVQNADVPVQSNAVLHFNPIVNLTYQALLYELHDSGDTAASHIVPNWFGVAIPKNVDLSGDVYVILYFHPTPSQAFYLDPDYLAKKGSNVGHPLNAGDPLKEGTDWKQLFAYVDRLGGQMAGAINYGKPANCLVIFPFLTQSPYTLDTNEWFNIIHDILQDINTSVVPGICTRPKKMIVATLSNGSVYLNRFLTDASPINITNIVQVWDFDSDITTPRVLVDPHGIPLRAYWQNDLPPSPPAGANFVHLPTSSWTNFPNPPPPEVPPLPPNTSNSNKRNAADPDDLNRQHHYIRDTMFLDAVFNLP